MDEVESALVEDIRRRYGRVVQSDTPLSTLGVDSMQMADLVGDIEREFGIEVDQDIFDAETVGELAAYVRGRRKAL